ncbi:MAG: 16S rRNA (adenine(1518)-N(6)/adenine(1519)-N(6))-dimethyltransferase RsmA [Candidatus Nomurabacteria bacterium]|nr:16S rRNA (adenine(1518)-N(6)/adenine(1519)-N(6))-dimethyltransferase RsmA [Candidatus Nomurabacteria bacterium]
MIHKAKKSLGLQKLPSRSFSPETSFKAKKSLGQNFLKSKPALNMMISAGEVGEADTIVEIGPGKGALTEKLLEKANKVIAIEKDRDLIDFLKEKFGPEIESGKLELVQGDCLEYTPSAEKYKLIANIPYNITGAILKKFLSSINQPERMVLLIQKEVTERIVARDAKESILSISVKAYGTPKYMMKVEKRFFSPAPKVDSAIISITGISKKNFKDQEQENRFFEIVKAGFAHKRKVLKKNLEDAMPKEKISELFKFYNINEKVRAEDINLSNWLDFLK